MLPIGSLTPHIERLPAEPKTWYVHAARPDAAVYFDHAASGFRDFTRIAAGSPEMWRDIALANRDALLAEIDRYGSALQDARAIIAAGDGAALSALFESASSARRAWEAKRAQPVVEDKG